MSNNPDQRELAIDQRLAKASAKLQHDLAQQDMLENIFSSRSPSQTSSMELVVLKLEKLAVTIRMDGNRNHHRGHLHIDYKTELRASSFAIDSGKRLVGRTTPYDAKITAWILSHQADLLSVWDGMRASGYNEKTVANLRGTAL